MDHYGHLPLTDFPSLVLPCRRRYLAVDELHAVRVFAAYFEWTTKFDWCVCGLDTEHDSVYCPWSWGFALGIRWLWQHLMLVLYLVVSASLRGGAAFDTKNTTCEGFMLWLRGHVCSCCRVHSALLLYCSLLVSAFRQVVCVWLIAESHHCAGCSWIGLSYSFLPSFSFFFIFLKAFFVWNLLQCLSQGLQWHVEVACPDILHTCKYKYSSAYHNHGTNWHYPIKGRRQAWENESDPGVPMSFLA